MSVKIAPSIASSDLGRLYETVQLATKADADIIHLDVEDGVFIPSLTFGPATIAALRSASHLPFDVHLQVAKPEDYIEPTVEAGADIVSFQLETSPYPYRLLMMLKDTGVKVGAALLAATPLDLLTPVLDIIDVIHLMTAEPNGKFATYLQGIVPKVKAAAKLIGDRAIEIEVDGGVSVENAMELASSGATILVAGRAIWGADDPREAVTQLRRVARGG